MPTHIRTISQCLTVIGVALTSAWIPKQVHCATRQSAEHKSIQSFQTLESPKSLESLKTKSTNEKIRERLESLRIENGFPGMTVGYVLADGKTGTVSVGYSNTETKTLLTPNDKMLAGSIGKTYFAAVMLKLVEQGKLNLDQPISTWLSSEPWFKRLPNTNDITFRMLMNHTSGIPEHVQEPQFLKDTLANPDRIWKPEELIAYILDRPAHFPAGKGWSYADTNYIIAGVIAEKILKKPLYEMVTKVLLRPLRLTSTVPAISRHINGLINGYSMPNSPFGFEGSTIKDGTFIINPQLEWTGGGFASTALDLAKWSSALYSGKVLDSKMFTEMTQGVAARTGPGDKYGLGVQIRQSPWGVSYGHGGWFPGYNSEMEYFPEFNTAIAVQVNTDNQRLIKRRLRNYIAEVAQILLNREKGNTCIPLSNDFKSF